MGGMVADNDGRDSALADAAVLPCAACAW
jgi:hypothetical protein